MYQKINEKKVTYCNTYFVATCNVPNKKDVKTRNQIRTQEGSKDVPSHVNWTSKKNYG